MDASLLATLLVIMGAVFTIIGWCSRPSLPRGRVIYIDSGSLEHAPETLYDPKTGLAGRPDYIMDTRHGRIPVELKSSSAPLQPHEGHIFQLAAYCRLIESITGRRPPYGIIRYRDHSFRINYTGALRRSLRGVLQRIQAQARRVPARSHSQPSRCRACGYRSTCDQSL